MNVIYLFRTKVSGIRAEDLENAEDFLKVHSEVAEIIKDKIVVGQSIEKDLEALFLQHPSEMLRDTSELFYKTNGNKFSLKELAANKLGISFQVRNQFVSNWRLGCLCSHLNWVNVLNRFFKLTFHFYLFRMVSMILSKMPKLQ